MSLWYVEDDYECWLYNALFGYYTTIISSTVTIPLKSHTIGKTAQKTHFLFLSSEIIRDPIKSGSWVTVMPGDLKRVQMSLKISQTTKNLTGTCFLLSFHYNTTNQSL